MAFNICPCWLCGQPMSYNSAREGVYWFPSGKYRSRFENFWYGSEPDVRLAHKRCWKAQSEPRRKLIRYNTLEKGEPICLGQTA